MLRSPRFVLEVNHLGVDLFSFKKALDPFDELRLLPIAIEVFLFHPRSHHGHRKLPKKCQSPHVYLAKLPLRSAYLADVVLVKMRSHLSIIDRPSITRSLFLRRDPIISRSRSFRPYCYPSVLFHPRLILLLELYAPVDYVCSSSLQSGILSKNWWTLMLAIVLTLWICLCFGIVLSSGFSGMSSSSAIACSIR